MSRVIVKVAGFEKKADAEGLAKHYKSEEHPFTACMEDPKMREQYPDEERRKRVCGKMKSEI